MNFFLDRRGQLCVRWNKIDCKFFLKLLNYSFIIRTWSVYELKFNLRSTVNFFSYSIYSVGI